MLWSPGVTAAGTAHNLPPVRHIRKRRPQRVLPFVVNQREERTVIVIEWIDQLRYPFPPPLRTADTDVMVRPASHGLPLAGKGYVGRAAFASGGLQA